MNEEKLYCAYYDAHEMDEDIDKMTPEELQVFHDKLMREENEKIKAALKRNNQ